METLPEIFCAHVAQIIAADAQKTADYLLKKVDGNWVRFDGGPFAKQIGVFA